MKKTMLAWLVVFANSSLAQGSDQGKQKWQQFHQELQAACGSDLQNLCGSDTGRAKFKCLRSPANAPSLTQECATFLESHPGHGHNKPESPPAG